MNEPYRDATLGDMMRERRTTLGMTMREVAGNTVSPTAINNIEKGKINPTIDTLLYLCDVLKLPPEQALIFYPDITKSAPALLDIVSRKLDSGQIDESIALLYDIYWVAIEQTAPEELIAKVQVKLAHAFGRNGRYESARNVMNEAYKHYLIHRDVANQINCLNYLGTCSLAERHINIAISTFRQAVELAHRYQLSDRSAAESIMNLAHAHYLHGDLEEALYFNKRSETLYDSLGEEDEQACNAIQQAMILAALGQTCEAHGIAEQAHRHFAERDDPKRLADAARTLGDILCLRKEYGEAKRHYQAAYHLLAPDDLDNRYLIKTRLSRLELALGNTDEARRIAEAGLRRPYSLRMKSKLYKLLAQCDYQSRCIEGYVEYMHHAIAAMQESGDEYAAALIQSELADETNDFNLMRTATRTLRRLFEERRRHEL